MACEKRLVDFKLPNAVIILNVMTRWLLLSLEEGYVDELDTEINGVWVGLCQIRKVTNSLYNVLV